jgi:hypothetical protein
MLTLLRLPFLAGLAARDGLRSALVHTLFRFNLGLKGGWPQRSFFGPPAGACAEDIP